ncbi:hypothetical protein [Aliiroseovarius crassostreae]|nr:hypothetical protein [Aliiroseovarius crassostreae]
MRNIVFVGTLCAGAVLGVAENANPIVSQQQFRNLIGETCLGTIALRDPVWYRMGGNGKGSEAGKELVIVGKLPSDVEN